MWSHRSRVEGPNHLPRPAGHTAFDAAQDTVGFPGCKHTLLTHVQFFIHNVPPSPSSQGCSLHPAACTDTGDCPDPGAGPCTFDLAELQEVLMTNISVFLFSISTESDCIKND